MRSSACWCICAVMTEQWSSLSLISQVHLAWIGCCCEKSYRKCQETSTISWITDYLTDRLQYAEQSSVWFSWCAVQELHRNLCSLHSRSPGTPQTSLITPGHATYRQYSDDSAVVGCISDDGRNKLFVGWSVRNHLWSSDTTRMVKDFRRKRLAAQSIPLSVCRLQDRIWIWWRSTTGRPAQAV